MSLCQEDNSIRKAIDGDIHWYNPKTKKLHREAGLPAIELGDGSKFWYVNGILHRDGGLPAIEYSDGQKEWWVKGERFNSIREVIENRDTKEKT